MKKFSYRSKRSIRKSLGLGSAGLCTLAALLANNSARAQSQYYTTATVNGGTYSWDSASWNAANSTANTGPYTSTFVAGQFGRFYNMASQTDTITVNAAESMAGMYLNSGASADLTVNAGNGVGALSVVPGTDVITGAYPTQGFLTGGGTLTINAPITGSGGVEESSGGGHLQLFGNNTYSGGTVFSSSATFVDFNSVNSFSTGPIGFDGTTFSLVENEGPAPLAFANNLQIIGTATTGIDFTGPQATTFNGTFTLASGGTPAVNIRNNGVGTAPAVTFNGVMTLPGTVTFSGANGGVINLNNTMNLTGAVNVGIAGDTNFRLVLGASSAIGSATSITMAGGTMDPGGYNQLNTGTLGLSATSTLDFEAGAAIVEFANSSAVAWTSGAKLMIDNYGGIANGYDLLVGSDATGLTSTQLAAVDWELPSGYIYAYGATIDSSGELQPVPEPSSIALGVIGGLGVLWNARRKKA